MLVILEMDLKAADLQHEMSTVKSRGDAKLPVPAPWYT
jgi:hypothetical protein